MGGIRGDEPGGDAGSQVRVKPEIGAELIVHAWIAEPGYIGRGQNAIRVEAS